MYGSKSPRSHVEVTTTLLDWAEKTYSMERLVERKISLYGDFIELGGANEGGATGRGLP